jgi:RNA polymerase sigma-70 factor, ECF subfamily
VHAGESLPSDSFEQLAIPHFERLYNFACWLTHDRKETEDLVPETCAKRLRVFQRSGKRKRACCCSVRMGSSCGGPRSTAVAHREILRLCEVEGMSYQEISATLAIPMGTVMSRLSSARKALDDDLRLRFQKG